MLKITLKFQNENDENHDKQLKRKYSYNIRLFEQACTLSLDTFRKFCRYTLVTSYGGVGANICGAWFRKFCRGRKNRASISKRCKFGTRVSHWKLLTFEQLINSVSTHTRMVLRIEARKINDQIFKSLARPNSVERSNALNSPRAVPVP